MPGTIPISSKESSKIINGRSESPAEQGPFFKPVIQPKLVINDPNDHYEKEADSIAERVLRAPLPETPKATFFKPAITPIQRSCSGCQEEVEKKVSRKINGLIQRQEKEEPPDPVGGGFKLVLDNLTENNPAFSLMTEKLGDKFLSQPAELSIGVPVFLGANYAGLVALAIARPEMRRHLNDFNLAMIPGIVPQFPVKTFTYKILDPGQTKFQFEVGLDFEGLLTSFNEKVFNTHVSGLTFEGKGNFNTPKSDISFSSVKVGLGFFNDGLLLSGGYDRAPKISMYPQFVPRTYPDEPLRIMEQLPGIPAMTFDRPDTRFMVQVDLVKLYNYFNPGRTPIRSPHQVPGADTLAQPKLDGSGSTLPNGIINIRRKCASCEEEDKETQRKELPGSRISAPVSTENYIHSLSNNGQQLSRKEKAFFEPRFNQDFSGVRIHTDGAATESAKQINALAYTHGSDIVFAPGQYQPGTEGGKQLLAHELTHTIQQNGVVSRKTANEEIAVEEEIRTKLEEGKYASAYLQLNDHLEWGEIRAKKAWLAARPSIRYLFLRQMPSTIIAEIYSADELRFKPKNDAFAMIDCWHQKEEEKELLYTRNLPLFDHLLESISPYTGTSITDTVEILTSVVSSRKYEGDKGSREFHTIHLLTPSVERKIKFYNDHKELFKAVSKKFDPFTGISKGTMEKLTDTNAVDRNKAVDIYNTLQKLPEEQRRAFLDTAAFAGALEADKDAEAYYKKNYKPQYKALPHNWDSAILPWNWGKWDAPFAERLTIDHAALMAAKLNYEDKATRKFGFDRGIDKTKNTAAGKTTSDAEKLLTQLSENENFNNPERLGILLAIGVRGGLESSITDKVLRPKKDAKAITALSLAVIENYGFLSKDGFKYHADKAVIAVHDNSQTWYIITRTLGKRYSGKVYGEQRGTFDVRKLQDTEDNMGSLGGIKFGDKVYEGDDYYNKQWLDEQVKGHPGSESLVVNLGIAKGNARRGQIFASIRNDIRQANIYASTLPIEDLNYFAAGSLYRSGPGVLQGLAIHLSWTKDTDEADNNMSLVLGIDNIQLDQFQLVAPKSTIAIGHIGMRGLRINVSQRNLPAAEGLFIGLLKNADFTIQALTVLLPNVLKLLPYAVMTMTEEFQGAKAHVYKDALGAIMQQEFFSLKSSLTFTSLAIRNLFDTSAGFLDDISIEQRDAEGNLVRQGLAIRETYLWNIDAGRNIKGRIKTIDQKIRAEKANLVGSDADEQLMALEEEKKKLLNDSSGKALRYESRDEEMNRLREINKEIRRLTQELDAQFEKEKVDNPLYNKLGFQVLEAEKLALQNDLDYLDNRYFDDKKIAAEGKGAATRFEARRRKEAFEAKYKSAEVAIALRGITLHGGKYVRDLLNDSLQSLGFQSPELQGLENITIGAVDSAFTASSQGTSSRGDKPGVAIRQLKIPLIKAPHLSYKTEDLTLEGGSPLLQDVWVSVAIDFAKNPLDKNPAASYKFRLTALKVEKATFSGLTIGMGKVAPVIDFPAVTPVSVWGFHIWDYDPEKGNIHLKIRDVKAEGTFTNKDEAAKTSQQLTFGIDTTTDNETEAGKKTAIELHYNKEEGSIATKLNIASARIPALDVQSPGLSISSIAGTSGIDLKNVQADVKVTMGKDSFKKEERTPTVVEINRLHLDEITAQGIRVLMSETVETETAAPGKKPKSKKVQEVMLPKNDTVSVKDIELTGLRVTMAEEGTTLSTIGTDAALSTGKADLGGISYAEKNAKGSVLKAVSIHRGKFDALNLEAIGRNGRAYSLNEFFKFFGRTRLENLDASVSYGDAKTSATVDVKGKKNQAISVDYHEGEEDKPGYYDVRLPLSRINVPALHIGKDEHVISIPKPASKSRISYLNDVDVKLRAYVEFVAENKVSYDIYLQSLDVAEMGIYGLEYHNTKEGIDVIFDKAKVIKVPNVKAGGFRFSSSKGFDVFGRAGGWATAGDGAAHIEASMESITARLTDGGFLAESSAGRSALSLDIASLGFKRDKDGNMTITLGAIKGGFPKMTITQRDASTGAVTVTTIGSMDESGITASGAEIKLKADKNTVIDVFNLTAGGINIKSVETKGKDVSTTTVKLDSKSLGADSANVKLNADNSKEITLTGIKGGKISADLVSDGAKGKSVKNITLPDPDLVKVQSVKILIDPDKRKRIIVEKPSIKHFNLRMPSQEKWGDFINIFCDLLIDGNIELGDGDFASMELKAPFDAFVVNVPGNVPVQISNLKLEYKDTTAPKPGKDEPSKSLNQDQVRLLELEQELDAAAAKLSVTKPEKRYGKESFPNPDYPKVKERFVKAKQAFDSHKAAMVGGAKAAAQASMTKKYLDAVEGTVTGSMDIFNTSLPLNIETHSGEKYVQVSDQLVTNLKSIIRSLVATTIDMPFWSSDDMKAIGEGLKRWYIRFFTAPTAKADIDSIADGDAARVIRLILEDIEMWPGILEDNANMFGINLNIEGYWALDVTSKDSIGIGLCEAKYQHPDKKDFYNLYGFVEHLQYVSPALVSKSGQQDSARLKRLKDGLHYTEDEINDMDLGDAVMELVAFIKFSLSKEATRLKNTVINNIHGVSLTGDISLRPQEVLNELLKEKQAGSIKFDKGKDKIEDIHFSGKYEKGGDPLASGDIGGGSSGIDNLFIPGATYLSQDKGTKVSYDSIELTPLNVTLKDDIYQLLNKNILLKGLKVGVLKK